jgi:hypothetical protein
MVTSMKIRPAGHVVWAREMRTGYKILFREPDGKGRNHFEHLNGMLNWI